MKKVRKVHLFLALSLLFFSFILITLGVTYATFQYQSHGKIQNIITSKILTVYKEEILNGTDPVLSDNLVPVIIASDGTVSKASIYEEWYSYEDKEWANAVILKDETESYSNGEIIPESSIESYFVWIPKYSYKLFDLGNYDSVVEEDSEENIAKEIEIRFGIDNTSDENINECTTPLVSGENGLCELGDYLTHPAFTSFDSNGMWVGKFETGCDGADSTTEAEINSVDTSKIIIKPNVYSWRNITVVNMFKNSYDYMRSLDSHMMKNTEWGAVTYLSHSKYGINNEVNINNDSSYLTGKSGLLNLDQTSYPGVFGTGEEYNKSYNIDIGYQASTTGNISGIYDMSGGAWEYTAAYLENTFGNSGFDTTVIKNYDSKYFDLYNSSSTEMSYNNRILGDATGEMGPFYRYKDENGTLFLYRSNWYKDSARFIYSTYPWFIRGGGVNNGMLSGQFYFWMNTGVASGTIGFRIVLTP